MPAQLRAVPLLSCEERTMRTRGRIGTLVLTLVLVITALAAGSVSAAPAAAPQGPEPRFTRAVAFDTTAPLRDLAVAAQASTLAAEEDVREVRPDRGPDVQDQGYSGDGALQGAVAAQALAIAPAAIPAPL